MSTTFTATAADPQEIFITEWAMEMQTVADVVAAQPPPATMTLMKVKEPSPDVSRALYGMVGAASCWTDRFTWTFNDWHDWVSRPEVATWLALAGGTIAGFFELEAHSNGDTEIQLLGLNPTFVGRGYGSYLIEQSARQAWARGALWGRHLGATSRVTLRTSSLDHPNALEAYSRRGFAVTQERSHWKTVVDPRWAPWPLREDPRQPVIVGSSSHA